MKCCEIMKVLEELSPKQYALDWDNVGLLVGDKEQEIHKIYVTLDVTERAVDEAVKLGADMIVSHHPMIFSKIKRVTTETPVGRKILKLSANNICCYAMHTNFDVKGGMSELMAEYMGIQPEDILEETAEEEGIGRIGQLKKENETFFTVQELAEVVKKRFDLDHVFVYGDLTRETRRIALSPGSGKSMFGLAAAKGADVLISGDFGHHEGLDAVELGIAVIDATHAGIERIFIDYIANYLEVKLGTSDVQIEKADKNKAVPVVVI